MSSCACYSHVIHFVAVFLRTHLFTLTFFTILHLFVVYSLFLMFLLIHCVCVVHGDIVIKAKNIIRDMHIATFVHIYLYLLDENIKFLVDFALHYIVSDGNSLGNNRTRFSSHFRNYLFKIFQNIEHAAVSYAQVSVSPRNDIILIHRRSISIR